MITELDRAVRGDAGDAETEAESIADMLVAMVQGKADLFHDAEGAGFASFQQKGHRETWPLQSTGFREWLAARFYGETGKVPREASTKDAVSALAGMAKFDGPERKVWLRVARVEDRRYFIDLCNETWQAVEIGPEGWRVVDNPPVCFRRTPTMAPLPLPVAGGKLDALWEVVNIPAEDRPLVLAWLLECWRPDTHSPVLELSGEQGSGKSDTQDRLRQLVDPSEVNLRAAPKTVEDIFVAAANNWLVSFNNLSHLTAVQQDALCTLSTGGGFAGRTLYTNCEETLIEAQCPVAMNGISTLATAQDLIDRTIRLELPMLRHRRRDSDLRAQFEQARPGILGALLSLFRATLVALPAVELSSPARAERTRQIRHS